MPTYYEGPCFIRETTGELHQFRNEHELEAFQARCPHANQFNGTDGLPYCCRCYVVVLRRLNVRRN